MNNERVKTITGVGALTAIVVILQILSNYVAIGPVSITLALIPIVLGALLYGPWAGLFLGLVMGGIVLTAPSTQLFLGYAPLATVFLCLLKTGIAGFVAGFMPKIFKLHQKIAVILASILVPIINTGLFAAGFMLFFRNNPTFIGYAEASNMNMVTFLFLGVIGFNFLIEFGVNSLLSPTIYYIYKIVQRKYYREVD